MRALALRKSAKISGLPLAASSLVLFSLIFTSGLLLGDRLAGEGDGAFLQLALLDQLVDQAQASGFRRGHVAARGDHLQRVLDADHARQALGAAGAGQQAEGHFRQAEARRGTATR